MNSFKLPSTGIILSAICLMSFLLMIGTAWSDGPIVDELAHIPAGYGYARFLDYRLNPEHPPLVKIISALPLLALDLTFPTERDAWKKDVNGQWTAGTQFFYESGNDSETIVRWARIGPILLTILLIILIWLIARTMIGSAWALLPAVLVGLSPTILAHGHYVTTDIGAGFGCALAIWQFVRYLQNPSKRTLIFAGLAFGIAQLLKFSAVLIVPLFIFLAVVYPLAEYLRSSASTRQKWGRWCVQSLNLIGKTIGVFLIGGILIYAVYFLFTFNEPIEKQVADTQFILQSLDTGVMGYAAKGVVWMSQNRVTRPLAEYMLGVVMVNQRAAGGNTNYFLGHVSSVGSPWYFPTVYGLKESLPVLIMIAIAFLSAIKIARKKIRLAGVKTTLAHYLDAQFLHAALLAFIVLYWAYSINSPLNIGIRHLLPTIPLIYILTASAWKTWIAQTRNTPGTSPLANAARVLKHALISGGKYAVLAVLLLWFIIGSLTAAPFFLSYFNPLAGATANGYRFVTDSNYDWGQDMERFKIWLEQHPEVETIAIDYFGGANPEHELGTRVVHWSSSKGSPTAQGIHWIAISINTLQSALQPTRDNFSRKPEDEYRWLEEIRPRESGIGGIPTPDAIIGTSIFIYRLD